MQGVFLSEKSASVQKKANIRHTNHVFQAQPYNSKDAHQGQDVTPGYWAIR
jgi:hypothetical protein